MDVNHHTYGIVLCPFIPCTITKLLFPYLEVIQAKNSYPPCVLNTTQSLLFRISNVFSIISVFFFVLGIKNIVRQPTQFIENDLDLCSKSSHCLIVTVIH